MTKAAVRIDSAVEAGKAFFRRYVFDPNLFSEEILNFKPDPWQREANIAVADYVRSVYFPKAEPLIQQPGNIKNYFSVVSMHGSGKTAWLASLICWFGSMFDHARIPCMAPKYDQLKTRLFFEIQKLRRNAVPDFRAMTELGATTLNWCGFTDWIAMGQTAKSAENLAGLHHTHQLVVCDEASGIKEELFPVIFGALTSEAPLEVQILVMIGNPTKNVGTFYQSQKRPVVAKDYHRISITLATAPRVSRKWVERMVARYGKDSPIVKIRCFGEFATVGELQLIALDWITRARERWLEYMAGDGTQSRLRLSIDVADGGEDMTVMTIAKHWQSRSVVLRQRSFSFDQGSAATRGADEAEVMFNSYGGRKGEDDIVVDSLGVGSGMSGVLIERGHRVVRYMGGAESTNSKRWRNARVQAYMVLRDALRDGVLAIHEEAMDPDEIIKDDEHADPWDEFDAQLCSIRMNVGAERVEDLVTKEKMKELGLVSPDRADSLAMQYAQQTPALLPMDKQEAPVIQVIPSDFMREYVEP